MSTLVEDLQITELWKSYKANGGIERRNELVLFYAPLVKSIVRRVAAVSGNYADAEDLSSYGMIGLIKAVEKYDLSKGVSFETFATYRVRGEIIDYMRRNDWMPRTVRKRMTEVGNTMNGLMMELGRQPTEDEIMKKLGIRSRELSQTLAEADRYNLISFEELIYDTIRVDSAFPDLETPEKSLQESELLEVLTSAVEDLPERERLIVTLYYYEELTLKEISGIIGVSESRVSQIHTRAIEKMKQKLVAYING